MTRHTSSLSPSQRQLVELLQRLNFGTIERLTVRDGQPVLHPSPRIIREVKFGAENGPRNEPREFVLKSQLVEFFDELRRIGDGVIDVLTVRHGLPFSMSLTTAADAK